MTLTFETAQAERSRLLDTWHFHKREMRAAKRALDRLEADCARVGIRLIRVRPAMGESNAHRTDPDAR